MTRREFVGAAALAAAGTGLKTMAAAAGAPNLRVGIMSDVHCHHPEAVPLPPRFESCRRAGGRVLLRAPLHEGTIRARAGGAWFDVSPDDASAARSRGLLSATREVDGMEALRLEEPAANLTQPRGHLEAPVGEIQKSA